MGKLSQEVKDRTCLTCGKTFKMPAKALKAHAKACKG